MSKILHIHAEQIESLDDIYTLVESYITDTTPLTSRNLDALYDVLSDIGLQKVIIHQRRLLQGRLDGDIDDSHEMSPYYRFLDILMDLDGVDIELDEK